MSARTADRRRCGAKTLVGWRKWQIVVDAVIALAVSCSSLDELEAKIAEQSQSLRNPPEHAVDGMVKWVKDEDVRSWLIGNRVIEDLRSGLEHVRESYIRGMVRDDYLRLKDGMYWVTAKATERFRLPKVMGCDFPK